MFFLVFPFFCWSLIWISIAAYTPEGGFHDDPASNFMIEFYIYFHWITTAFLLIFYYRHWKWIRMVRLDLFEQQIFVLIGILACLANIGINIFSNTFGLKHARLFVACTVQNTLIYNGLVYYIMIIDSWNMKSIVKNANRLDRFYAKIMVLSQFIINITLICITLGHYLLVERDSLFSRIQLAILTIYRSWLIYFGTWKLKFLYRKCKRWNCSVFVKYQLFEHLTENANPAKSIERFKIDLAGLSSLAGIASFGAANKNEESNMNEKNLITIEQFDDDDYELNDGEYKHTVVDGFVSVSNKCGCCGSKRRVNVIAVND